MAIKRVSPVEAEKIKAILRDPVLWAKAFVVAMNPETKKYGPWIARDYQAEILRNRDIRKVYRMGRRLGKCLPGWIKILNPVTGEYVTIEELYKRKETTVVALNEQYQQSTISNCLISNNGNQAVYRVQLTNGRYIDGTDNHPLFTVNGWTEIKDLNVNDYVAMPSKLNYFGNNVIDVNVIKLLAYMIGDGNCVSGNLRFTQQDNKQLQEFKQVINNFNCKLRQYSYEGAHDYHIVMKKRMGSWYTKSQVRQVLEEHDVYGHTADNKRIPAVIFTLQKPLIATFISRLWSTDGWATCNGKRIEIGYASNSKELIYDLAHLLLRFGIRVYIRRKTDKSWTLGIYDKASALVFANEIGIFGKEKALMRVLLTLEKVKNNDTFMPLQVSEEIADYIKVNKIKKRDIVSFLSEDPKNVRLNLNYKLQQWKAKLISDYLGLTDLAELCTGNIEWVQVKNIQYIGEHKTYNLSVPEMRNFVANDIYVHNTECMCIDGLWQCFTHKNYRVLYVTPYENQVNLIFMRMREIVNESPLIKAEVVKMKNSPYTIEFANGSVIMGFTTGASTGQAAASIRGQKADWLFLDEVDYMNSGDYGTVSAIANERADIGITLSSTPTGRRDVFWRACTDPSFGYTHFHIPSQRSPLWTEDMEVRARAELTQQEYEHEVLAEFGTEEMGVFNKDALDLARRQLFYTYEPLNRLQERALEGKQKPLMFLFDRERRAPQSLIRTLGVDFDKYSAGSSLIILDYDIKMKKFIVMKRIEVPRGEYTLDNAVKKIIEVNDIYNPRWIFIDRGYGKTV